MQKAPLPADEVQRLRSLYSLHLLDTLPEERFERITRVAQHLFGVSIASITLIDANRQWFKSCLGMPGLETSRDIAFCAHAILSDDVLVIPDTRLDPRFVDNPLVTGDPFIRFYAGQPLKGPGGHNVGTLCLIDPHPRDLSASELQRLRDLAHWAENELNSLSLQQSLLIQRQAEEALQKSEARFRAIFDETAIGIALVDMNGKLLESNSSLQEMLGYTREELGQRDFTDITHPDDIATDLALYTDLVQRRRKQYQIEKRYLRKDATVMEGRLTVSLVHQLAGIEAGDAAFAIGMVEDITDRKQAEAQLRKTLSELERQYRQAEYARSETRAILDAASEAIILVAPDRRFLTVNRKCSELFGFDLDDVLGRRFEDIQVEVERGFANPNQLKTLVAGTAADTKRQFTEIVTQVWPVTRELELFSTPVRGQRSEHLGRLYVFRDVTHEREVDRMKSEFVSLVSHELRTPLTSIKGYVDLLIDGDAGDISEEQQEYLGIVKNNADRLVALINDLLDVSRIESGRVELHRSVLDLASLIEDVADSLRPQIEQKGQRLTFELDDLLPTVLGDADRITQILTNLLSNAYKYTPRGGTITVVTRVAEHGQVQVDVRDTGIGLSAEEQEKLFTKFYRAKNPTTQEVGGTGLGLAITRSLVEMHGGTITVESMPGRGSTFSFTLPASKKTTHLTSSLSLVQAGGRVLVVDDEPDIASLIRRYLEHAHYQVLLAHNAAQAISVARDAQPDLITLDIMLPDADGFTVLEWLKSDPLTASIPVVMLSMMDDSSRGKLLGAVDYLRKPIEERVLLEHVALILASDRAHTVLVADDDVDLRNLIAGNLRRAGYQVLEAADGTEAVALARHHHPGLALIDIRMPGMDGISALRELRAELSTRSLPVIMMTASPGVLEESRSVVESLGGVTLLSKPCTPEELAAAIARGATKKR